MAEFDINQILQRYGRNPNRINKVIIDVNKMFPSNNPQLSLFDQKIGYTPKVNIPKVTNIPYTNYLPPSQPLLTTSGNPMPNVKHFAAHITDEPAVNVYRVGEDGRFYGMANKAKDAVSEVKPNLINSTRAGTQLSKNVNDSLQAAKTIGDKALKYGKIGGRFVSGRVMPALATATYTANAIDDNAIADKMQQINAIQPNTYSSEQIAYYRNRARASEIGIGTGALVGGVAGAGAFSLPGALIGSSIGPTITRAGYWLGNLNNDVNKNLTRDKLEEQLNTLNNTLNKKEEVKQNTNNTVRTNPQVKNTAKTQAQQDSLQKGFDFIEQSLPYEDDDVIVE